MAMGTRREREGEIARCSPDVSRQPATFAPIFSGGDRMIGTITKRARQDGKPAWGYSFFAGRTLAGKRIQITKSGFDRRKEATDALRKAIEQHRFDSNATNHLKFAT